MKDLPSVRIKIEGEAKEELLFYLDKFKEDIKYTSEVSSELVDKIFFILYAIQMDNNFKEDKKRLLN